MNPELKYADQAAAPREVARQYAALPWRMSNEGFLEVLLVTSRRRGRWIVPKGWQLAGCTSSQSAEREAFEQAGVVGCTKPEPIGSYHFSRLRDDGSLEPRHVIVFGLHVRGALIKWPERDQRKRRWSPIGKACDLVDEPGLAVLLRSLGSRSSKVGQSTSTGATGQGSWPHTPISPELESASPMRTFGAY